MSLYVGPSTGGDALKLGLWRDGTEVAHSVDQRYAPEGEWVNNSASLLYREQMQERATFKLCYEVALDLVGREIKEGWAQYGVKIYGPGYNFRSN